MSEDKEFYDIPEVLEYYLAHRRRPDSTLR